MTIIQLNSAHLQVMFKYYSNPNNLNTFQKDLFEVNTYIVTPFVDRELVIRVCNH